MVTVPVLADQASRKPRIFLGESYAQPVGRFTIGAGPRMGPVDGFAVLLEPCAKRYQARHLDRWNCAISLRTNVEQKVAVLADDIHEVIDQLVRGNRLRFAFGAVVAERASVPGTPPTSWG